MARLHPKGQYPSPVSIAVSTESPVAKIQVAIWLPAKIQYEPAGTNGRYEGERPFASAANIARAEAFGDDLGLVTKSVTSQTQLSKDAFQPNKAFHGGTWKEDIG